MFGAVGMGWLLMSPAAPPAVTILPPDYVIPSPAMPLPDRWIPMNWGWLWKLRYALLGKPPVIDIETKLLRLGEISDSHLQGALAARVPHSMSNGVRAFVLPESALDNLGHELEAQEDCKVAQGSMTSGQGVLATLSMTTGVEIDGAKVPVGDSITYAIVKRRGSIELTGSFHSWAAVTNAPSPTALQNEIVRLETNMTLAATICVPAGQAVLLYDTNRVDARLRGVGVLIQSRFR